MNKLLNAWREWKGETILAVVSIAILGVSSVLLSWIFGPTIALYDPGVIQRIFWIFLQATCINIMAWVFWNLNMKQFYVNIDDATPWELQRAFFFFWACLALLACA